MRKHRNVERKSYFQVPVTWSTTLVKTKRIHQLLEMFHGHSWSQKVKPQCSHVIFSNTIMQLIFSAFKYIF